MKLSVHELLEKNGVVDDKSFLRLLRGFDCLPRCHTLPIMKSKSVAEHTIGCIHLLYYLNIGRITPPLSSDDLKNCAEYLMYHDLNELLVGDIPYYVAKFIDESEITSYFKDMLAPDHELSHKLYKVCKFVDMLEFYLHILEQPNLTYEPRLEKVLNNAVNELNSMKLEGVVINIHDLLSVL